MTPLPRPELEKEAYRILKRQWEFPIIKTTIDECNGDIESAITRVYRENSGFCIFGGASGPGDYSYEVSLLKSGYFHLWQPGHRSYSGDKPDLVLTIKEIFELIKNGPSNQLSLF